MRSVNRGILKERFVSTLQEQASLTQAHQGTLILLVLGHGDGKLYGVYLGGNTLMDKSAILKTSKTQRVLPKKSERHASHDILLFRMLARLAWAQFIPCKHDQSGCSRPQLRDPFIGGQQERGESVRKHYRFCNRQPYD